MKKKKILWFSISTLIFSLIAILISIKSYNIADESLKLSEKQYLDKFNTIWSCIYYKEKEVFGIKPTNENVILQKAFAYYPDEISETKWPFRLPEHYLYMTFPKYQIQEFIKREVPSKPEHFQVIDNASIPIVIESYYSYNGYNFYDKSLYILEYLATISDNPYTSPNIDINGLTFGERLDLSIDIKIFLNGIWNEADSFEKN